MKEKFKIAEKYLLYFAAKKVYQMSVFSTEHYEWILTVWKMKWFFIFYFSLSSPPYYFKFWKLILSKKLMIFVFLM